MDGIPLRRSPTSLPELLSGALEALRHQAEQREVDLRIETNGAIPLLDIDPEKVAWAVTTLVGNSLRFVRRGTRLMPGGSVVVRLAADAAGVTIVVEDDGPGIPAEKLPWLFVREPGKPHAAGLALMLVHDVAAAHGGSVEAWSVTSLQRGASPGFERGTRITMRLPAPSST